MRYQVAKYLKNFLDIYEMSSTDLAKRLGYNQAYISYIINSQKIASSNFLKKFFDTFSISKSQQEELLKMANLDSKLHKLKLYEEKRNEILRSGDIEELNKKEKIQWEQVIGSIGLFYNDKSVSEEDKKKLHDSLQELFFDAKIRNKKRYNEK